jgi:hypothetical protein
VERGGPGTSSWARKVAANTGSAFLVPTKDKEREKGQGSGWRNVDGIPESTKKGLHSSRQPSQSSKLFRYIKGEGKAVASSTEGNNNLGLCSCCLACCISLRH